MPLREYLIEELRVNQMNLSQVRLLSEALDVIEVLIGGACVRISFNADILDQLNGLFRCLAEVMFTADLHTNDMGCVYGLYLAMIRHVSALG